MDYKTTIDGLLDSLRDEEIKTWFDLGLFIDRLREGRGGTFHNFSGSFQEYKQLFDQKGIAFITFHYIIDGVTVEAGKYCELIHRDFPNTSIHYIGGVFKPESAKLIPKYVHKYENPLLKGFDEWKFYKNFFFDKLERGSDSYNRLILDFWDDVLAIIKTLGDYIVKNNIHLLYLINVCSNPGNISLALAMVLISECLGIPVMNNNHDYYWEGGNRANDIETMGLKGGPRDFFFKNAHLGEVFSLIEMLFPWDSRNWINVNINRSQSEHLIIENGHNPSNVFEIGTAVDRIHAAIHLRACRPTHRRGRKRIGETQSLG